MQNSVRRFLTFIITITIAFIATALPSKGYAELHNSAYGELYSNVPRGLYNKIPDRQTFKNLEPRVRELAIHLIEANADTLKRIKNLHGSVNKESLKISLLHLVPNSNYVEVSISQPNSLEYTNIRTNGEFAFLSSSYYFRENNKTHTYQTVGYVNNNIQVFSQTELILSTLPDTITISRVMGEEERQKWLNNIPYSSTTFGAKVHFGPNYFRFNDKEPYIINIQKSDLLEFLANNELEINTYDPLFENEMKLTELGLEFEYVIIGDQAIIKLMHLIQDQLR